MGRQRTKERKNERERQGRERSEGRWSVSATWHTASVARFDYKAEKADVAPTGATPNVP